MCVFRILNPVDPLASASNLYIVTLNLPLRTSCEAYSRANMLLDRIVGVAQLLLESNDYFVHTVIFDKHVSNYCIAFRWFYVAW